MGIETSASVGAQGQTLLVAQVGWIVTLVVALLGWLASAVISARERAKRHRLDVTEHARREVVPLIASYQDWIGELTTQLSSLEWLRTTDQNHLFTAQQVFENWQHQTEALASTLARGREAVRMFGMLEDYEVVFPQTREVRMQLVGYHLELQGFAYRVHSRLLQSMSLDYLAGGKSLNLDWLDHVKEAETAYYDMQAMMLDIRAGIQNAALSEVFNASVPEREPLDHDLPLVITKGKTWRVRNKLPVLPLLEA